MLLTIILIMAVASGASPLLATSGQLETSEPAVVVQATTCTVTFDSRNGSAVPSVTVESGSPVTKPASPTRSGYKFNGWFKDADRIYKWNFSTAITADRTLYADWIYIRTDGMEPAASPSNLAVIDLSQWNDDIASTSDDINFTTLAGKLDAVYLRAASFSDSRGGFYIDDQVASYAASATAAGLPFGFYIYHRPQADPAVSASHARQFYDFISQYDYSCIPVIDIEITNDLTKSQITASVLALAEEFRRLSGQDPMIYSGVSFANSYLGADLGKYRLWIANWYCTEPGRTTTWDVWDMWQYSAKGRISGVPISPVDLDYATSNIFLKPVTFDSQGGSTVASHLASYNSTIPEPATPTRSDYLFTGWYQVSDFATAWDFAADTVQADRTLYARWLQKSVGDLTVASAGYNSLKISWPAVPGADSYQIFRADAADGTYTRIKTVSDPALTYTDTGLATGQTYYYKVRAYASLGATKITSGYSAVSPGKPVPARPGSYKVALRTKTSIRVSWAAVTGASGYEVYRKIGADGTYTLRKTTTSLAFINTGLTAGKAYYYKVRAYRTVGSAKVYGPFTTAQKITP